MKLQKLLLKDKREQRAHERRQLQMDYQRKMDMARMNRLPRKGRSHGKGRSPRKGPTPPTEIEAAAGG